MVDWNLNVTPGGATGSLSAPPGMGGGMGVGPLMDMLRWKMEMQQRSENMRLAQIKQQMQLAAQAYSDQKAARRNAQMQAGRSQGGGLSAGPEGGAGGGAGADEWDRAYKYAEGMLGGPAGSGQRDPQSVLNLAKQIYAMGPQAAHQGFMQTGRLIAGMATGAAGMASDQSQQLMSQGIDPSTGMPFGGRYGAGFQGLKPGQGAKEGGYATKTGKYKLHKGEAVLPASRESSGSPLGSYQQGTMPHELQQQALLVNPLAGAGGYATAPGYVGGGKTILSQMTPEYWAARGAQGSPFNPGPAAPGLRGVATFLPQQAPPQAQAPVGNFREKYRAQLAQQSPGMGYQAQPQGATPAPAPMPQQAPQQQAPVNTSPYYSGGAQGAAAWGRPNTGSRSSPGTGDPGIIQMGKKANAGSFEKGGRVPKTGTYKLHQGEVVVPTKLADVLMPAIEQSRKSTGKARKSYKEGTVTKRNFEKWLEMLSGMTGMEPGVDYGGVGQLPELLSGLGGDRYNQWQAAGGGGMLPSGMPASADPALMAKTGLGDQGAMLAQQFEDPALPSQPGPMAGQGPPTPTVAPGSQWQPGPQPQDYLGIEGLSMTEEPLSRYKDVPFMGGMVPSRQLQPQDVGMGQQTVKKYTLTGTPETAGEKQQRELDKISDEIDQHREAARGFNASAMTYQRYAAENINKPSAQSLMAMSKEYSGQAKQMSQLADTMQKDLDARREVMTIAETNKIISEIGAGGREREAEVKASGQIGAGRESGAQKSMGRYLEHLQETDPERYERLEMMLMMYLDPQMASYLRGTGLE